MRNMTIQTLAMNHSMGHHPSLNMPPPIAEIGHGARQPPRNRVTATPETLNMLMYSARKYHANFMDEYSTMWPATSSPSASGRSKGRRLTSPTIETRKMTKAGRSEMNHQSWVCASTICDVDIEPETMNTDTSESPMDSS